MHVYALPRQQPQEAWVITQELGGTDNVCTTFDREESQKSLTISRSNVQLYSFLNGTEFLQHLKTLEPYYKYHPLQQLRWQGLEPNWNPDKEACE